jgi:Transposase IS116/IS110/IS902 family
MGWCTAPRGAAPAAARPQDQSAGQGLCGLAARPTHQHHRRHQDHPADPGPPLATTPGRARPSGPPAPGAGHLDRPGTAGAAWSRGRNRRPAAGHRGRQPPPAALGGRLRAPVRRRPIPASSGRTDRHRFNRGGDRRANNALWRIALVRMRCHPPTKAYVERRTEQGLSKLDILRCLKRHLTREIYQHLTSPPPIAATACPK